MHNEKAGIAVFVKSRVKHTNKDEWQDGYLFGGHFNNIGDSLNYLQFLEKRETEFIVQIGFVGYGKVKTNA
jgi:hypothetical protein